MFQCSDILNRQIGHISHKYIVTFLQKLLFGSFLNKEFVPQLCLLPFFLNQKHDPLPMIIIANTMLAKVFFVVFELWLLRLPLSPSWCGQERATLPQLSQPIHGNFEILRCWRNAQILHVVLIRPILQIIWPKLAPSQRRYDCSSFNAWDGGWSIQNSCMELESNIFIICPSQGKTGHLVYLEFPGIKLNIEQLCQTMKKLRHNTNIVVSLLTSPLMYLNIYKYIWLWQQHQWRK